MNKKWFILITGGIIILLAGIIIYTKPSPPPHLRFDLKLSGEQRKQIIALKQIESRKIKANFEKIRALHEQLNEEFLKDSPDEAKIQLTMSQIKRTQIEMTDIHFNRILELRKILTPSQFKNMIRQLQKHRPDMRNDHRDRRSYRGQDQRTVHNQDIHPEKPKLRSNDKPKRDHGPNFFKHTGPNEDPFYNALLGADQKK